jgi:hypothetical protein
MSRRYGRNQKRAARQALAEASQVIDSVRCNALSDRGLLREMSQRLAEIRRELDDAKRIAGRMSILFPATTTAVQGPARDSIETYLHQSQTPMSYLESGEATLQDAVLRTMRLPMLVKRIQADRLQQAIHARVKFGDGLWRYGISMDAVQGMPTRELADLLSRELGLTMAQDLHEALQK